MPAAASWASRSAPSKRMAPPTPRPITKKASKLVIENKLPTVFGSYTSASRKAVLPVFEKRNSMYFYPTYYEGYECSRNVVYTGAVPNQQLSNFIPWIIKTLGKKTFFIVGSDYIYPREMAKVCKILIEKNGGKYVADEYLELGHSEWGSMVNKIKGSGCDVVLSNVVGDSVVAFYREYKNQGITHDKLPICATVTSEIEIAAMGAEYAVGSYTSFPYFQAIDLPENKSFIERYRAFVKDPKAVTHHAMCCAYFQVFLWKQAVEKAKDTSPNAIREAVRGQTYDSPRRTGEGRGREPPYLAHAAHRPMAGRWPGQDRGCLSGADHAPPLCGLWRDGEQPVLHAEGRRPAQTEGLRLRRAGFRRSCPTIRGPTMTAGPRFSHQREIR